jgi:hypothetical protein
VPDVSTLAQLRDGAAPPRSGAKGPSAQLIIDYAEQEQEIMDPVNEFLQEHRDIGALVLEYTNLALYSAAIERTFGVLLYVVIAMLNWFDSGIRPKHYR